MTRYFQGDVFLYPVAEPIGEAVPHNGAYVIAKGEGSHQHVIRSPRREAFDVFVDKENDITTILFRERCDFLHESNDGSPAEHAPLSVEPGVYEVAYERELDHFTNAVQRMTD